MYKTYVKVGGLLILSGIYVILLGWILSSNDINEVDWKEIGVVTAVKDQTSKCSNASWVFAAVASLEGLMGIKEISKIALQNNNKLQNKTKKEYYSILKDHSLNYCKENLSEQQVLDCTPQSDNCSGGSLLDAYSFVKDHGIVDYQLVIYIAKKEICPRDRISESVFNITSYQMTSGCDNLKKLIFQQPVAVKLDYTNLVNYQTDDLDNNIITINECPSSSQQYYNSKVNKYHSSNNDNTGQYQYVLVTAYDGKTFTIKNSVGIEWGYEGYAKLDATIDNLCNICDEIYYPISNDVIIP